MRRRPKYGRFFQVDARGTLGDRIIPLDRSDDPESVAKSKLLIADRAVAGRRPPRDFDNSLKVGRSNSVIRNLCWSGTP